MHALDHSSRRRLGCGTAFQIVIELESGLNSSDFEKYLAGYCAGFPHLTGKVCRDFNLAPYWKRRLPFNPFTLKLFVCSSSEEAGLRLETELNLPAGKDAAPLRVIYAEAPQKKLIGFIFDHRLFDARGAEKFLHGFQAFYLAEGAADGINLPPSPAHLNHWSDKFAAGKKINRARIAGEKDAKIKLLKAPVSFNGAQNRFKIKTFSESETHAIAERAGPFMFLPFSLAVCMQAVRGLFLKREEHGGDLAVSVTRDMRMARWEAADMFFNHLSFMFFREKMSEIQDFKPLLASLKNQFYEHVKNKMPEALADASMLMRIVPLALLARGVQSRAHAPASFSFASLGKSAYLHETFMDVNVVRLFHMPRLPPLPGLGIFLSEYKNRLNVTLSYLDNVISDEEAGLILEGLAQL